MPSNHPRSCRIANASFDIDRPRLILTQDGSTGCTTGQARWTGCLESLHVTRTFSRVSFQYIVRGSSRQIMQKNSIPNHGGEQVRTTIHSLCFVIRTLLSGGPWTALTRIYGIVADMNVDVISLLTHKAIHSRS